MRPIAPTGLFLLLFALACGDGRSAGPQLASSAAGGSGGGSSSAAPGGADDEPGQDLPGDDGSGQDLPADLREQLEAHNRLRARHCAPPLEWSEELADVAGDWADELVERGCVLQHSQHAHGENLFMASSGMRDPAGVAGQWHAEKQHYDFRRGGFSMETGHFTQLVWVGTRRLGCARRTCNGLDLWVCMYDPPGNVRGEYREHVRPTSCR